MLKYYEVENFRSFKQRTKFSLEKTNYKVLEETNTVNNLLKGALFVGANASGKSNALLPVKYLLEMLFGNKTLRYELNHCLFSTNPSLFMRFVFDINGSEIDYSIQYHDDVQAWRELLIVDGETLLERNNSYATVLFTEKKEYSDIQPDTLFLREIYFNTRFRGNKLLQDWFAFLSNSIYLDLYKKQVTAYKTINIELKKYLDEHGTDEINQFFKEYNFGQSIEYSKTASGQIVSYMGSDKRVYLKRDGINEPILFEYESTGTQNLLSLFPSFFEKKSPKSLVDSKILRTFAPAIQQES